MINWAYQLREDNEGICEGGKVMRSPEQEETANEKHYKKRNS